MDLTYEQLICEAIECNHAGVGSSTLERYREHLVHFSQYLASVQSRAERVANKSDRATAAIVGMRLGRSSASLGPLMRLGRNHLRLDWTYGGTKVDY